MKVSKLLSAIIFGLPNIGLPKKRGVRPVRNDFEAIKILGCIIIYFQVGLE